MNFYMNIFAIVFLIQIEGCSNTQKTTHTRLVPFEILVGRTGGFSNLNPVWEFKSSGEVLKSNTGKSPFYLLRTLDRTEVDSLSTFIQNSHIRGTDLKFTGNMTNFMEYRADSANYKITWVDPSQLTPELKELYQFLMRKLK